MNAGLHGRRIAEFAHDQSGFEWDEHHHGDKSQRIQLRNQPDCFRIAERRNRSLLYQSGHATGERQRNFHVDADGIVECNYRYGHGDDHRHVGFDDAHGDDRFDGEHGGAAELYRRSIADVGDGHSGWQWNEHDHCHQSEQLQLSDDVERFWLAQRRDGGILDESGYTSGQWKRNLNTDSDSFRNGDHRNSDGHRDRNVRFFDTYGNDLADGQFFGGIADCGLRFLAEGAKVRERGFGMRLRSIAVAGPRHAFGWFRTESTEHYQQRLCRRNVRNVPFG